MWHRKSDPVVVGQFFTRRDIPQRFDDDTIPTRVSFARFDQESLAVRFATVIQPARDIASHIGINQEVLVEREQEGVTTVDAVTVKRIGLFVGAQKALVFDDVSPA